MGTPALIADAVFVHQLTRPDIQPHRQRTRGQIAVKNAHQLRRRSSPHRPVSRNEECEINEWYKYDIDATELCETCLLNRFDKVG